VEKSGASAALEAAVAVLGSGQLAEPWAATLEALLNAAAKASGVRALSIREALSADEEPTESESDQAAGGQQLRLQLQLGGTTLGTLVVHADDASRMDRSRWAPVATLIAVAMHEATVRSALEAALSDRVSEIAAQRTFIERIVDSLPVGLYVVDREYRIQAWNHKRETGLQGVSRKVAIGRTIFDVLHRQPAALLKREFDEVFASGRLQQFQSESDATGSVRSFRISKIPMRLDDARPSRVTHVITIGEDITDWRAALDRTAQSEKLAALGQMATGVMHEINNPLATIAAVAETFTLQADDRENAGEERGAGVPAGDPRELLHIIDLEVQRCKKIVQGLLDFGRPKPFRADDIDLNAVVRQALFLLQHHPRSKRISLVTELESAASLRVSGDADRLVQVLMALVLNSLDASADGARVLIRTRSSGESLPHVIDVVDEGHGIPRESLSKVFEPFYTTKDLGRGTGLGLSICYGLIMEHGGVLLADSRLGHGSTFRILLPPSGAPPLVGDVHLPALIHEPLGSAAT
jgi:two-component system NtrC family sensor kinase